MKIKTLDDFTASVLNELLKEFPGCEVQEKPVTKNNGIRLCGITVKPEGASIAQNVYMEEYFADFQKGCTFADIIKELKTVYRNSMDGTPAGINVETVRDFSRIKDSICYMLVNKELNAELLQAVPHRDFHGLAVIYYVKLAPVKEGFTTVKVTDSLADLWGIGENDLYQLASVNTPRLDRGCVMPLLNIPGCPAERTGSQDNADGCTHHETFDFSSVSEGSLPMYLATNAGKTHGAAVILYKGLLEAVAERTGSFFVLPSSIHECIFVPGRPKDAETMTKMVKDVNHTEVAADAVLYDGCFYYDAESHELQRMA